MLVKFTDKWGDPVAINPDEVIAVTVQHTHDSDGARITSTVIHIDACSDIMSIPVKDEYSRVMDAIN